MNQIWCYCQSGPTAPDGLVAVVSVNHESLWQHANDLRQAFARERLMGDQGHAGLGANASAHTQHLHGFPDVSRLERLEAAVLAQLDKVHAAQGLKPYERVLAVHLVTMPFSDVPDLMTPSHRLCRYRLELHFHAILPGLFERAAARAALLAAAP